MKLFCLVLFLVFGPQTPEKVVSSWYGPGFHGKPMANGETFNQYDPKIAAHKELPFGTIVELQNLETGATIEVVIKDRGPFTPGRDFDISRAAAIELGIKEDGLALLGAKIFYIPPD